MVTGLNINLFEFQDRAVQDLQTMLAEADYANDSKRTVVVKAPTGAGKTIIMIALINEYLKEHTNTAFIWLCPGKGDLEEQSREKMQQVAPLLRAQNLFDALTGGFVPGSTTFINWELVTKNGNNAIRDGERKNLFDRIADAHRAQTDFIVIVDEEHSHNTSKANDILKAFSARYTIRVSATAKQNSRYSFYEIPEAEVIAAGLITKALYVNEGVQDGAMVRDDYDYLLELADKKRQAIAARYQEILPAGRVVRPLVLIQFPNGRPDTIEAVEKKLEELGYTYDNGMVSKWMSGDKQDIPDNLTANDGAPVFLLMKQAISTGWDCPRAKILVKLREGMSESFQIQTIGRIRRMPEARHYEDDLLDFCYIYTFDEEFKAGLLGEVDRAYEMRRLFVKDKCKTFTLTKEMRDLDYDGLGEREVFRRLLTHFRNTYNLGTDFAQNAKRLVAAKEPYELSHDILNRTLVGRYTAVMMVGESTTHHITHHTVNTHQHGRQLMHEIDSLKRIIGLQQGATRAVLEKLFRAKKGKKQEKLLALELKDFYAFVINNAHLLREEFRAVASGIVQQQSLALNIKTADFSLPEQDFFKYDSSVKDEIDYLSNAYAEYTSGFATGLVRSTSELLFEKWCDVDSAIDWVYKNGDTGQQYFSIVYFGGTGKQRLFYPDYIVKMHSGAVWLIETKGGEFAGADKNIDIYATQKFMALKKYAENHGVNWGFVRDKDTELYINNSDYYESMAVDAWQPLGQVLI